MSDAVARFESPPVCSNPIFVVGTARSGTNILARSLGRHPDLWTSGESHFLFSLFGSRRRPDLWVREESDFLLSIIGPLHTDADEESFTEAGVRIWLEENDVDRREFLTSLSVGVNALFTSRSGGKRWIDHTPHYVLMGETLSEMFPGARFLNIVRDGRRVVHSMSNFAKRPSTRTGPSGPLPAWATDFRAACRTWTRNVRAGIRLSEKFPERFMTVLNEDLVRIPRATYEKIYDFVEVPRHPAPIRFTKTHRLNSSFTSDVRSAPVLSDPWVEWGAEEKAIFVEESGDLLVAQGFATREELASWRGADAFAVTPEARSSR